MDTTTVIIGMIVIIALWVVITFNVIVGRFNRAKRAWGDVITYERLKNDTLPQLADITEDFKEFESGLLKQVTELRTAIQGLNESAIDTSKLAVVEQMSRDVTESLRVSVEAYPELKTNRVVQQLMQEISDKNTNVAAAITLFNRGVEEFNNSIQYFPNSFINTILVKKTTLDTFSDSTASSGFEFKPNF